MLELALESMGGFAMAPGTRTDTPEIPTVPCELDESWTTFESELGNFKQKMARVKRDMSIKMAEIQDIHKSASIAKMILDNIPSEDLKTRIASSIQDFETQEDLDALTQQYAELRGQYDAMKKVLENTDAERYAKFTCFICMDRLVDLFLDPCGHVVCEPCWANTRDKRQCPGCRTHMHDSKKIFNM
jgi:hypothetical protein